MIQIGFDAKEIQKAHEILKGIPGGLTRALSITGSEVMKSLRTKLTRGITSRYYIKSEYVRRSMRVISGENNGELLVRSRRSTLGSYMQKPRKAPQRRKHIGYLEGAVRKDKGLTKFTRGFVMKPNGLALIREGRGKHGSFQGLHVVTGPAVSQLAGYVMEERHDELTAQINSQYKRALSRVVSAITKGKIK